MSEYETEVVSNDTGEVLTPETPEVETPTTDAEETVETTEEATPETPAETQQPEDKLVELPDGRRLTPEEVAEEYIKLNSDYTRKSQKLATYEKGNPQNINNQNQQNDWQPQTWDEVLEKAVEKVRAEEARSKQQEQEMRQQFESQVSEQIESIKANDPSLNESQLFAHAMKYGFKDLGQAYQNMKDMQVMTQKVIAKTEQNLKQRSSEPVSGGSQGGNIPDGDTYEPDIRNQSLTDFLKQVQ